MKIINQNLQLKLEIISQIYSSNLTGRHLYKAYSPKLGIYYALKVYEEDKNQTQEIQKEIISYNRVAYSANFAKVHMFFRQENKVFLLMDYIDAKNLSDHFKAPVKNTFETKQRLNIALECINLIEKIHNSRILHRDIKPENVLIKDIKNPKTLSIIDFGLSALKKQASEGTPLYNSPEQDLGLEGALSPKTDVFSLAKLVYFLLHAKHLALIPNDDFNDHLNLELKDLQFADNEIYKKALSNALKFNAKERSNLNEFRGALKELLRSVK